jgi:hypothetical protein
MAIQDRAEEDEEPVTPVTDPLLAALTVARSSFHPDLAIF